MEVSQDQPFKTNQSVKLVVSNGIEATCGTPFQLEMAPACNTTPDVVDWIQQKDPVKFVYYQQDPQATDLLYYMGLPAIGFTNKFPNAC